MQGHSLFFPINSFNSHGRIHQHELFSTRALHEHSSVLQIVNEDDYVHRTPVIRLFRMKPI